MNLLKCYDKRTQETKWIDYNDFQIVNEHQDIKVRCFRKKRNYGSIIARIASVSGKNLKLYPPRQQPLYSIFSTLDYFKEHPMRIYTDSCGNNWIPRTDISNALEYPCVSCLSKLHSRHRNKLYYYSFIQPILDTSGKLQFCTLYSFTGIKLITDFSQKENAAKLYKWVLKHFYEKTRLENSPKENFQYYAIKH